VNRNMLTEFWDWNCVYFPACNTRLILNFVFYLKGKRFPS
jgi:hypothetical protein